MAFVTIIIAMVGYGIAKSYRYYLRCQRNGLLDPPPDLSKSLNFFLITDLYYFFSQ